MTGAVEDLTMQNRLRAISITALGTTNTGRFRRMEYWLPGDHPSVVLQDTFLVPTNVDHGAIG